MINKFRGEYYFLSNFYMATVVHGGIVYPSSEHAYQAAKTLDDSEKIRISKLPTAGQAKKAGREVEIRSDWDEVKVRVMEKIVWEKFIQNDYLKEKLLTTGNEELVEGNDWGDRFWGVDIETGVGENHLGKVLMETRQKLMEIGAIES